MLRTQLTRVALTLGLSAHLYASPLDGLINSAIDDMVSGGLFGSMFSLECDDFNLDYNDVKFSILGCELELSTKDCYKQTVDSIKDLFPVSNKRFDKDELCEKILAKELEIIKENNPFEPKNNIDIKKLPKTISESEKHISKEKDLLISSLAVAPKNTSGLLKKASKEASLQCALADNRESCSFSKALALMKKETEDYKEQEKKSFAAFNRDKYIALSRKGDLYTYSEETLERQPVGDRAELLRRIDVQISLETVVSSILNAASIAEEATLSQMGTLVARSVTVPYREIAQEQASNSSTGWELP